MQGDSQIPLYSPTVCRFHPSVLIAATVGHSSGLQGQMKVTALSKRVCLQPPNAHVHRDRQAACLWDEDSLQ